MQRRHAIAGILTAPLALRAGRSAHAAVTWDLYIVTGLSNPIASLLKAFAEDVRKRTRGELTINVRLSGELPFRPNEMVRITGRGQVQLGEAIALFNNGTIPLLGIGGLPMLLGNVADMEKALPIIQRFVSPELERAGVKVLFAYAWPALNIFGAGKPIRRLEDFNGRKLRTLGPQQGEMLKRLGASSVTMTTPEVAVALERGTVEGVFTAALSLIGNKWPEFAKWGYMPDATGGDDYILVNTEAYNKLAPKLRQTLDEAAAEWGPKITREFGKLEKEAFDTLRTQYKIDLFFPPKDQVDAISSKMTDYWTTWAQQNGPNAAALMKEVRAAVGK